MINGDSIDNLAEFVAHLQAAPKIQDITRTINGLDDSKLKSIIINLLKMEDDKTDIPDGELKTLQDFWHNQTGQDSSPQESSERYRNIEATLLKGLVYVYGASDHHKEVIDQMNQTEEGGERGSLIYRTGAFFNYLNRHYSEEKLLSLMQQFCQYVNLLAQTEKKEKIKECLFEFPPHAAFLNNICIDGTLCRIQEQIRKLIFPRYSQPFFDGCNSAIKKAAGLFTLAEGLNQLPLVKVGNHAHVEPFLEYCLGLKLGELIKDQSYTLPRGDIPPNKLWQVFEQFPTDSKDFVVDQYKNYNGAIALFTEYENIAKLWRDVEDPEKAEAASKSYNNLIDKLKDLGFEESIEGLVCVDTSKDDTSNYGTKWNWSIVAKTLEEFLEKDFNQFSLENGIVQSEPQNTTNSEDSEISDYSSESGSDYTNKSLTPKLLLDYKAKDFANKILTNNEREKSLTALWVLSYLEDKDSSHAMFMEAIYELGERYYEGNGGSNNNLDGIDHFYNGSKFLESIKDSLSEDQRFRIDCMLRRINDNKLELPLYAVAYQNGNEELVEQCGNSSDSDSDIDDDHDYFIDNDINANGLLNIALDRGFENLIEKLITEKNWNANYTYKESTLLNIAIKNGHRKMVRKLLDLGASHDSQYQDNRTAISYAAEKGDSEIITMLSNADVNLVSKNSTLTPLYYAAKNGHIKVVKELIKRGAKLDVVLQHSDFNSFSGEIKDVFNMQEENNNKRKSEDNENDDNPEVKRPKNTADSDKDRNDDSEQESEDDLPPKKSLKRGRETKDEFSTSPLLEKSSNKRQK